MRSETRSRGGVVRRLSASVHELYARSVGFARSIMTLLLRIRCPLLGAILLAVTAPVHTQVRPPAANPGEGKPDAAAAGAIRPPLSPRNANYRIWAQLLP